MDIRMSNIASPMPQIRAKFTNKLGIPLSGCKVYTYEPNSNIPKTTWVDIDKTVENTNPILLDAAGEADIFLDGLYRVVVKDRFGFVVYDVEKTGTHTEWEASFVVDGGENQHQINRSTIRTVETIADLIAIQNPYAGQTVQVLDELRGGKFEYKASRASENNGGTVFNGWVRKYFGSVYLDWFCETDPATTDCSVYMERALAVTRGIKCGGMDFLFTGRVGIPDIRDPLQGNEQSNYAYRVINIRGDGDTVFHIDCAATGLPAFTSARSKENPTSTENIFVGKVEFKDINFHGVNTTFGWELNEANKNGIDVPFDGDRLYNSSAMFCNFVHLKAAKTCQQNRGVAVEKGNNYSQSFILAFNHFYHCDEWVSADELINFRCVFNQGERNYAGIKATNPNNNASLAVCSFDYNLFESGGVFIDAVGDIRATSIWNNYFEYNIYGDMTTTLAQINITGEVQGGVIGANNFVGQIDFTGYDTEYVDIKITGKAYNESSRTDVTTSKPLLIGNMTTSRKLISDTRGISIANSTPYTLKNGWEQVADGAGYYNSMMLKSAQENDVSFFRGVFNKPLDYSAAAVNGTTVKALRASDASVIVAILDLSRMEGGAAKNKISTITGELNCNIELVRDGLTIGNASACIHVSIFQTGFGESESNQYDQVRVFAKLLSIIQPYDIPIVQSNPSNLLKKQFVEPEVSAVVEPLGGGRYAVRLTNYLGAGVGTFGAPSEIYSSNTWQASVGCRDVQEQVGANVSFIGYWW